jgi:hypothetical protein
VLETEVNTGAMPIAVKGMAQAEVLESVQLLRSVRAFESSSQNVQELLAGKIMMILGKKNIAFKVRSAILYQPEQRKQIV